MGARFIFVLKGRSRKGCGYEIKEQAAALNAG
jgi:hypothetical protein